jgi:glucose/arabinose dehydrogenase
MKMILTFCMLLVVVSSIVYPTSSWAQSDGCQLGAWIMEQQPHTTRTPEIPAQLEEHSLVINGSSRKVYYPHGFKLEVFAQVATARGLALSPDGVVYVTSYANGGRVYALPDHNHDGVPDSVITVATGLGSPHGIGFYNGDLYVSNNTNFYRMVDANNDRVVESSVSLLTFPGSGHNTRNFVFDTFKNKVYIQVGSASNMGNASDSTRAIVLEANPDGSGSRIYARGLRNAVGMDIDPRTGVVWVNNNGMDNLFGSGNPKSNDNPSEAVYMLCDGAHYGWPWTYGFQIRNPTSGYNNLDTAIIRTFNGPVAEVLAHEAPLGLHFYRGNALPATYRNVVLQTYHGSWNRTPPAPPRVTAMWVDSNGKNARVTDLINGFQPDSTGFRYGRVVSIIEGADGALYISDDAAGCVYKFWWEASKSLSIVEENLAGKTFAPQTQVTISWSSTMVDSVDIYFTSDGINWIPIARSGGNSYLWTVPNTPTTKGQLKLVAVGETLSSQMLGTFSIVALGVTSDQISSSGLQEITISPNPSTDGNTMLHYGLRSTEDVSIELLDVRGAKVRSIVRKAQTYGEHSYELDLRGLAAGTYTILVSDSRTIRTVKLSVIH